MKLFQAFGFAASSAPICQPQGGVANQFGHYFINSYSLLSSATFSRNQASPFCPSSSMGQVFFLNVPLALGGVLNGMHFQLNLFMTGYVHFCKNIAPHPRKTAGTNQPQDIFGFLADGIALAQSQAQRKQVRQMVSFSKRKLFFSFLFPVFFSSSE